jgi:hypothetical protein
MSKKLSIGGEKTLNYEMFQNLTAGMDMKTLAKRIKMKRNKFFNLVMNCFVTYDDFWKELSLESPELIKVRKLLL